MISFSLNGWYRSKGKQSNNISRDNPLKMVSTKINAGQQHSQGIVNAGRQCATCVDNVV